MPITPYQTLARNVTASRVHQIAHVSLVALLAGLTACSGGGGGSSGTTAPPVIVSPPPPPPPLPLPPSPPVSQNLASETDITYGSGLVQSGAVDLKLDLYQPEGDCTTPRPFIVGIHGGGFVNGTKSGANLVENMEAVAARGFIGISIQYRLVGDDPVVSAEFQPIADDLDAEADRRNLNNTQREVLNASVAAIEDTVTALDWAQSQADARCLDADNFALWGSSAGAIAALHVGHALDNYFIDRPVPRVVIDYWGRLFLDGQVDATDPPFMIIHGTADESQIYEETALVLAAEADAVGLAHSFYTIEGGPHGFNSVNPDRVVINGTTALEVTVDFIEAHLTNQTPLYESQTVIPTGG